MAMHCAPAWQQRRITLNLKKYKRLFTFGCSLTKYYWPTWADIIAREIPEYHNYGQTGGGNLFISNSVIEANIRHGFTEHDLVMVMWSSVSREDRYKDRRWETPGNIYTQNVIDMEFVSKWADTRFYLLRDLGLVELTRGYLKSLPCDSEMLAMCKFDEVSISDNLKPGPTDDVLQFYRDTINSVRPNIVDTVYDGLWPKTPIKGWGGKGQTVDYHPTPSGYFKYLQALFPEAVTDTMKDYADKYEALVRECSTLDDTRKFWQATPAGRL